MLFRSSRRAHRRIAEGASLASRLLFRFGGIRQVHKVARRLAILLIRKSDVQIGRRSEHVKQHPQPEASAPVRLKAKIDIHPIQASGECARRDCGNVASSKVAAKLVVKIHKSWLAAHAGHASPRERTFSNFGTSTAAEAPSNQSKLLRSREAAA